MQEMLSLLNGFQYLPAEWQMTREEMQTAYGRSRLATITAVLGSGFAFLMAFGGVYSVVHQGVIGHKELLGVTMSLVAGTSFRSSIVPPVTNTPEPLVM